MENVITIHTDGSCHGNPGPGGYAAIIEVPNHDPITVRGGEIHTTNNRMEILAVICGIRELTNLANVSGVPINVRSDSAYVVNAFRQHWLGNWQRNGWRTAKGGPVKNRELWEEMLELTGGLEAKFLHVKGHSGDRMNEKCDRIANEEAAAAAMSAQDRGATAHQEWTEHAAPRNGDTEQFQPPTDGFTAGYEACKQELAQLLENLKESPHPPHWDYTDGFSDCRNRLREHIPRMEPQQPAFREEGNE